MDFLWKVFKLSKQSKGDKTEVNISPQGTISISDGGSTKITACVVSNQTGNFTFNWQKIVNGIPNNLKIDNFRYCCNSSDRSNLELVINDVDDTDNGEYQLEVIHQSGTTYSPRLKIDVYKDKTEVDISPQGTISISDGGSTKITACVVSNQTGNFTFNWQKIVNGIPNNLKIDNFRYCCNSSDRSNLELVINDVDDTDNGEYQLEVIHQSGTTYSPRLMIDVYKDKKEVDISPQGTISISDGGSTKITACVVSNQTGNFTFNWQKIVNGIPNNLKIDNFRYCCNSSDRSNLELVINDVDDTDNGEYQLEVIHQYGTTYSPRLLIDVYKDSSTSISKEDTNFIRFQRLCQLLGTEAVRLFFIRHVPETALSSHLSKWKSVLTNQEINRFFQAGYLVKSTDFDLSLLYKLIRHTVAALSKPHSAPSKGWGKEPAAADTRETDDVERIRLARNSLAHNIKFTFSDADFQTQWIILSKAIDRLSKGSLINDVNTLLIQKFDRQDRQEMIERLKGYIDEKIEGTMERIEQVETRHIPLHIREKHLRKIQQWKEEDTVFTEETKLFESAWNAVVSDSNVNIIFVGGGGTGKTATARHIALNLEETYNYEIVPVDKVEEIALYTNVNGKQVFLLDDVLGIFSLDTDKYNSLESYKESLLQTIGHPSKILFTCRRTVYNDARSLHTFVTDNCIDLESVENKLTDFEKIKMMKKHGIDDSVSKRLSEINVQRAHRVSPMFPLLCKMFAKNKIYEHEGVEFFFRPVQYLLEELDKIRRINRESYATLILCILNGNNISQDTQLSRDIKEEVYNTCGLSLSTPDSNITDAILRMDGTYLTYNGSYYTCIHDSIFEIAAYHYGKQFPKLIIKYMSSAFVSNKIKVDNAVQGNDLCINIEKNQFMYLAERLYEDIQLMKLYDVFSNPALKFPPFLDTFVDFLNLKSYNEVTDLFLLPHSAVSTYFPSDLGLLSLEIDEIVFHTYRKSRVIRWVILFGHSRLLKYFVVSTIKHNEIQRLFDLDMFENYRLLALACVSKNKDTTALILQNVRKASITGISRYSRYMIYRWITDRIYSPLYIACVIGDMDIVELLIKELDHDDIYYIKDLPPLCAAAQRGHYNVVQFLLEKGADINRANGKQNTPLYLASYRGHTRIVQYLLKNGALVDVGSSPLCGACQGGNIDIVKMLVEGGIDINRMEVSNRTPLSYASLEGEYDVVKYLVEKGADVNLTNKEGKTPLNQASYNGHTRIVQYLLKNGALTDVGCSPLCGACQSKNIDIVKMLVEGGMDVNKMDLYNRTPLFCASEEGEYDVVKYLVENGADVNLTNKEGETPLYQASYNGHTRIVQYLLTNGALTDVGCSPLCGACQSKNIDIVKMFVEGGMHVNKMDLYNRTPLFWASEKGEYDVVKYLVENEADVNLTNKEGETPLYQASFFGHTSIVQYLLKNGALTDVGSSPLCRACQGGNIDIVKMFVEGGMNVNHMDLSNRTPLYYASEESEYDVVKYLVENGAEVNLTNKEGETPLYQASYNGHTRIVQYLLTNGALTDVGCSPLCGACQSKNIDIVKMFVEGGMHVNKMDLYNRTPLFWASEKGEYDVVKYLVENEADVNLTNKEGETPLYQASYNGHTRIVQYLLKNGALTDVGCSPLCGACQSKNIDIVKMLVEGGMDVNKMDLYNRTPLFCASEEGEYDVVKYLVENGADVNLTNKEGETPLYQASYNGHTRIVQYLLTNGALTDVGCSPLCGACQSKNIDIVKMFVEGGMHVNKMDLYNRTPLFWASEKGEYDVVKYLVENEADVNLTNKEGETPLYQASYNGHTRIVQYLLKNGALTDVGCSPLCGACQSKNIDIVKMLVEGGMDVNKMDLYNRTPLFCASEEGEYDVVKYLVENGADVNLTNTIGGTALYQASCQGYTRIVQYLLKNGALTDVGSSPLCGACQGGNIDIVKILVEGGMDINKTVGFFNRTSLYYASVKGKFDVVKYLVENGADVNIKNQEGDTIISGILSRTYQNSPISF